MGPAPHHSTEAGLRIARADLGYLLGAVTNGSLPATCFMPYGALVAYETDLFRTSTLGTESLLVEPRATAAARMANKIFDDKRASIEDIAVALRRLAEENEQFFRGGVRRRIARALGIFNPDLSVFMLDGTPLLYGTVTPFQLGLHSLARGNPDSFGPTLGRMAEGLGRLAQALGLKLGDHHGVADLNERLSALDAVSLDYDAASFGGHASTLDALLLGLLMNNATVGARLTNSACCDACASAAAKHRLVTGYQAARSLQLLAEAELLSPPLRGRVMAIADSPEAQYLRNQRKLRNSLVHLGLGDRSADIVEANDPIRALIEADLGAPFDEGASRIGRAAAALDEELTSWLLEDPAGVLSTLRPPQ